MVFGVIDWLIVVAYMFVVIGLGYWGMRRVKDAGGYLLANRKMNKWFMIAQTFSGGINSTDPMSTAASAYKGGLSGIWLALAYIFATPLFWMWPPVVRRMRVVTMIDMYRMRFGPFFEFLNIVLGVVSGPIGMGAGVKAAALMVVVMAGKDASGADAIGMHTAVAMIVLPTLLYTLLGGFHAIAATDLFQGLLIMALSFVALPFIIYKAGGVAAISSKVNAAMPNGSAWTLVSEQGFNGPMLTWYVIGVLCAAPLVYGLSSGAARNEMAARFQILGNLGKRFCTIGWALTGVFAIALYGAATSLDPKAADRIFATTAIDTLPSGLRGVMVAAMLAAVMSTIAGMMLGFGGMIVNNVYKNYMVRNATPKHYLIIARLFTAFPVALGWWVATSEMSLPGLFVIVQTVAGLTGIAVLAAIMWRRVTAWGAIASTLVMAPLFIYGNRPIDTWPGWYRFAAEGVEWVYRAVHIDPGFALASAVTKDNAPIQIVSPLYILVGIAVLVLVSLVTPQHNKKLVAEFYARLDTPLGDEDKLRAQGFQADTLEDLDKTEINAEQKDRDVSRRLLLLDFFTWPYLVLTGRAKLRDYWVDFAGIAGSIIFIAGFLWLVTYIADIFRTAAPATMP